MENIETTVLKGKLQVLPAITSRWVDRFTKVRKAFLRPFAEKFANIYFGAVREVTHTTESKEKFKNRFEEKRRTCNKGGNSAAIIRTSNSGKSGKIIHGQTTNIDGIRRKKSEIKGSIDGSR